MTRTRNILVAMMLSACGGTAVSNSTTDAGSDGGPTSSVPCPTDAPASGAACLPEGRACDYVEVPTSNCVAGYVCTASKWQPEAPRCFTGPIAKSCPADRSTAVGASCTEKDTFCYYGAVGCTCTDCSDNQYPVAQCNLPLHFNCGGNSDPACPPGFVRGGACATEGRECLYADPCESSTSLTCKSGVWIPTAHVGKGCPVSTRTAKKDIRYLDEAELLKIAAELKRTKLATYKYIDPNLGDKERLGFIIEDQPMSYAADPANNRVDLYGYMSMLVATLKVQEREIAELRQEIATVKKIKTSATK